MTWIAVCVGGAGALVVVALASLEPVSIPLLVLVVARGYLLATLVAQLPTVWMLRAGVDTVEGRPVTFRRIVDPAVLGPAAAAMVLVVAGAVVGLLLPMIAQVHGFRQLTGRPAPATP